MKRLILSLLAVLGIAVANAQNDLVATLTHAGNISTFYGYNALKTAYNAAENGDIITLSPGQFAATDIAKAITVRGAGMQKKDPNHLTIIQGSFSITNPEEQSDANLLIEGIYHNDTLKYGKTITDVQLRKCRLAFVLDDWENVPVDTASINIEQCKIMGGLFISPHNLVQCCNSYIYNLWRSNEVNSSGTLINCVVYYGVENHEVHELSFHNCYFIIAYYDQMLPADNIAKYCFASENPCFWDNIIDDTNILVGHDCLSSIENIDDNTFELSSTGKAQCIGRDGTEAGMYGGINPFNPTPTNPQITKFEVSNKATEDGKVGVEIQIGNAK